MTSLRKSAYDNRKRVRSFVLCLLTVFVTVSCAAISSASADVADASPEDLRSRTCAEAPLTILFATDDHYISQRLTDNGEAFTSLVSDADGKMMLRIEEIMDAFVTEVIDEKPDALILGGDITFNGARMSHEDLIAKLTRVKDAGIPVLVIPGNHDLGQYVAASFQGEQIVHAEGATSEYFLSVYRAFGYDDALMTAADSFSYLYALRSDLYVLMLDVNYDWEIFSHGERALTTAGEITEETLLFAEEALLRAEEDGAKVIAVSHQMTLAHAPMFNSGFRMRGAERVTALYDAKDVLVNLCGHMHIQHIIDSTRSRMTADDMPETGTDDTVPSPEDAAGPFSYAEIATGALSVYPMQYARIRVDGACLFYENVPLQVDFRKEALDFMLRRSDRSVARTFAGTSLSEEDLALAADTFRALNAAYFSGDALPDTENIARGIALWQDASSASFSVSYLSEILRDRTLRAEHHTLYIPFD